MVPVRGLWVVTRVLFIAAIVKNYLTPYCYACGWLKSRECQQRGLYRMKNDRWMVLVLGIARGMIVNGSCNRGY